MYTAFYNAAVGAGGQQEKMTFIANNLANVNTVGYKYQEPTFADLIKYKQATGIEQEDIDSGTGIRIEKADTIFAPGGYNQTGQAWDYCIDGDGFFALQDLATGEVTYTRDGSFILSQGDDGFYLASSSGKRVLDQEMQPILVPTAVAEAEQTEEANPQDEPLSGRIGVFRFEVKSGMERLGGNEYAPIDKNGEPALNMEAKVINGTLEMSNVDTAREFSHVIEAQRAYQYALKMLQTSDEVTETVNGLRR